MVKTSLMAVTALAVCLQFLVAQVEAQQSSAPAASSIKVCSLLTKEEVKKHLPWNALVDSMAPEEEAVGTAGSSCTYPSVRIQVLGKGKPGPPSSTGYAPVSGVGEEAYFRNNRNRYAELLVRVGNYTVTLQADADGNIETVKPRVVSLAQALIAKLR